MGSNTRVLPYQMGRRLVIEEQELRRNSPGNLLHVCWRQWNMERALARNGVRFRDTDPQTVRSAYLRMTPEEFHWVNGRQSWANWRTIPRSMSGLVPDHPLRILDLGCGNGDSTRVLAFYAPLGSHILAYDVADHLLEIARRRCFLHRTGQPIRVGFIQQAITEPFCDNEGQALLPRSVDLINSSGVVGHHLDVRAVRDLVTEIRRVIIPRGMVMLDVGRAMPARRLTEIMLNAGFSRLRHRRSCIFDPTGQVAFRAPEA